MKNNPVINIPQCGVIYCAVNTVKGHYFTTQVQHSRLVCLIELCLFDGPRWEDIKETWSCICLHKQWPSVERAAWICHWGKPTPCYCCSCVLLLELQNDVVLLLELQNDVVLLLELLSDVVLLPELQNDVGCMRWKVSGIYNTHAQYTIHILHRKPECS